MVFDSSGSSEGGRALWMENIMPTGGVGYPGHAPYGPPAVGMRSLPPYQPPPPPSRYHYPTYTSPWLVRVSHKSGCVSTRPILVLRVEERSHLDRLNPWVPSDK